MSNAQNPMDQVLSIVERLAANPNSQLTATNVTEVMDKVRDTVINGYKKVAEFQSSTSLTTADRTAAETARTETQPEATKSAATEQPETTATASTAIETPQVVASTPKAATKKAASNTVKSPAPKKVETEEQAPTEEIVAQAPEPEVPVDEDTAIVASMLKEHGSATAALAALEKNRKRGRKAAWHKMIEAKADEERRAAPKKSGKVDPQALAEAIASGKSREEANEELTGYKFAHIPRKPKMDPEKAIGKTKITCLIDGVARTMMSRYLASEHHMTPEEYIAHFGLRSDYPMTSPSYRTEKRRLAEVQKLGKRKAEAEAEVAAPAQTPAAATNRRTRARKAA